MADYPISKEAVVMELINLRDTLGGPFAKEVLNMALARLEGFQQMDAVPVVHGRWKGTVVDRRHQITCDECSVCDFKYGGLGIENFRYCPNCGAKMDEEEVEESG